MDWTEIKVTVPVERVDEAGAIVSMTVPYGIYIEDYSDMEDAVLEIAHIDLIDEDLLARDRSKGVVHVYISPEENPAEAVSFIKERLISENISLKGRIYNETFFKLIHCCFLLILRICPYIHQVGNKASYFLQAMR